jgi:hypothetical protein
MRIRWTTRIAVAVGVLTILAAIAAGGSASVAQAGRHSSGAVTSGATTGQR